MDNECKKDSSLSLVESLYKDLLESGYSFEAEKNINQKVFNNDPTIIYTEEEEADIAKGIF